MKTVEVFSLLNKMNFQEEGTCYFVMPTDPVLWTEDVWVSLESAVKGFKKELEEQEYYKEEYHEQRSQENTKRFQVLSAQDLASELYLCLYGDATQLYDRTKDEACTLFDALKVKVNNEKAK